MYGENVRIIAVGTPEDTIFFKALDWSWIEIDVRGENSTGIFEYCVIDGAFGVWWSDPAISGFSESFEIRHSTIRRCQSGISAHENSQIENCHFEDIMGGEAIRLSRNPTPITIRYCVFSHVAHGIWADRGNVNVNHCTFQDVGLSAIGYGREGINVSNSLFIDVSRPFSRSPDNVSFNCFFEYRELVQQDTLEGLGDLVGVNPTVIQLMRLGTSSWTRRYLPERIPTRIFTIYRKIHLALMLAILILHPTRTIL